MSREDAIAAYEERLLETDLSQEDFERIMDRIKTLRGE